MEFLQNFMEKATDISLESSTTLDDFGMKDWLLDRKEKKLYWTPYSIENLKEGDTIPSLVYDFEKEEYYFVDQKITKSETNKGTASGGYEKFLAFDRSGNFARIEINGSPFKDLEKAIEAFNNLKDNPAYQHIPWDESLYK